MEQLLRILNLSSPAERIRVAPNLDVASLALTPEEGFLLSRVDAVGSLHEIIQVSPFPRDITLSMLEKFAQERIIIAKADGKKPTPAGIDPEFCAAIEQKYQQVSKEGITPDQILGVSAKAKPDEIKKDYVNLTKVFHPDRFFRKDAGEYRHKIDFVFQKLNQSFETLSPRKAKPRFGSQLVEPILKLSSDRKKKALELIEEGKKQMARDPVRALSSFRLAQSFDPKAPDLQSLIKDLEPRANLRKSVAVFKRAQEYDELFVYDKAEEAYVEAAQGDPQNADYQRACGEFLLYKRKEPERALAFVNRALTLEPKNTQIQMIFAYTLKALKRPEEALSAFERVLQLDRGNLFAKTEVSSLQKELILSKKMR